jgi:hypothetical protein
MPVGCGRPMSLGRRCPRCGADRHGSPGSGPEQSRRLSRVAPGHGTCHESSSVLAPSPAQADMVQVRTLSRRLGIWQVSLAGVGVILGAGVYALVAPASAQAGGALWLSFLIAGVAAGLTGYAYARLGAMRPRASAEYQYTALAFGPTAGFIAGWLMLAADLAATAAVALGDHCRCAAPRRRRRHRALRRCRRIGRAGHRADGGRGGRPPVRRRGGGSVLDPRPITRSCPTASRVCGPAPR